LSEVPENLISDLNPQRRRQRERAAADTYDGPVLNSAENIRQFFAQRGKDGAPAFPPAKASQPAPVAQKAAAAPGGIKVGGRVRHAKYGVGTILRREGEGGDAKLTISFQGYGLKKLVEKYAELESA
jgi:DNA helicase-2/ATP-dependent DNA helicase PcrA